MEDHSSAEDSAIATQQWIPEAVRPVGAWLVSGVVVGAILIIYGLVSLIFLHRS